MGLVCTFGLVGNILSFITFGRMRQHNATVVLFRALAIADSLMLLSVMIYYVPSAFATYMEYASPIFGTVQAYLDLCFSIVLMIQCNTIWIAVLLAVNRYIAVCKLLMAASICTVGNDRKQLCFALVLSIFRATYSSGLVPNILLGNIHALLFHHPLCHDLDSRHQNNPQDPSLRR